MKHIYLLLLFIYPMGALPSGYHKSAGLSRYAIKRDTEMHLANKERFGSKSLVDQPIRQERGLLVKRHNHLPHLSMKSHEDSEVDGVVARIRRKSAAFESLKLHNSEFAPRAMKGNIQRSRSILEPSKREFVSFQRQPGKRDISGVNLTSLGLGTDEDRNKNAKVEFSEKRVVNGNTSIDILQRKTVVETEIRVANLQPNSNDSRVVVDGADEIKHVIDAVLGVNSFGQLQGTSNATESSVTTVFQVASGPGQDSEIMVNANRGVTIGNFESSTAVSPSTLQNLLFPVPLNTTGALSYQEKDVIMQSVLEEKSKETVQDKKTVGNLSEDLKRSSPPVVTVH